MKTPPDSPDSRWENLLRRAQADQPPALDLPSLQRAARAEARRPRPDERPASPAWTALLPFRPLLSTCLAGTCAFGVLASWQVWEWWQVLPWAQLLAASQGGAP
ncbi:MAG: hypothetical protein JNN01_12715 [Opitutaceae bacterium]|nr:hypothetical protein [Opitutaceae bacterium]